MDYGTVIVAPVNPTKADDDKYTYTFAGWEGYTAGMTVTGNATFKATYTAEELLRFEIGDVNMDGKINSRDALLIQQHAVKLITLTEEQLYYADTLVDGKINSRDALLIQQYAVKMDVTLGESASPKTAEPAGNTRALSAPAAVEPREVGTVSLPTASGNAVMLPAMHAAIAEKRYCLVKE